MRPRYVVKRLADFARAARMSREMEARERWPRERLEAYQRERLESLVRFAVSSSPFYRERLGAFVAEGDEGERVDLSSLPTLDKETLMSEWDRVVTDPRLRLAEVEAHLDGLSHDEYLQGRYRVMATGGTTGRRGVFVFDRPEWSVLLANFVRMSSFMGVGPRLPRMRVATVMARSPQHMTARYSETVDVGLHRVERFDARAPVSELVDGLNRFRPDSLNGYPSVLSLLALEQLEGRLRVEPEVVATSSEVRTEEMTENIRRAWGVEPYDCYGITEAGISAIDCSEHQGLHVLEDTAIFEVVDEDGAPVPDGERGAKLLVTNLFNRTMPLIRYELSDIVAFDTEPCACGRTLRRWKAVEGRSDDVLSLPSAEGGFVSVHPLAVRSPMAKCPQVKQYRIVLEDDALSVEASLRAGASAGAAKGADEEALRAGLAEAGAAPPPISVRIVDEVARGDGVAGKFKLVESRTGRATPARAG